MRSPRGLTAASAFLLLLPLAVLNSMLFDIAGEITVHFVAAVGFALLALSVFDFGTPRWMMWAACVAASVSAGTYLLQGIGNLLPDNAALYYVAYQLLGQGLEGVMTAALILWFVGLLLTASRNKTKLIGFAVMIPVAGVTVLSYGFSLLGGTSFFETFPILKILLLLPFLWLIFESAKKRSPDVETSTLPRPSFAGA